MRRLIYISLAACIVFSGCKGNRTNKNTEVKSAVPAVVTEYQRDENGMTPDGSFVIDEGTPTGAPIGIKEAGTIEEGEIVNIPISFINNTDTPFIINNVIASCGCTDVKYDASPVMTGEKRTLTAVYNSRGKSGVQYVNIKLITDRGDYNIRFNIFVNRKS